METRKTFGLWLQALAGIVVLAALYLLSRANYLLFHTSIELFTIIVAAAIFIVAWNSRRYLENDYLLFLGIALVFVCIANLLHALAYKGMGLFPQDDANLATQLWIVTRCLLAGALLIAPFYVGRRLRVGLVTAAFATILGFSLAAIFYWRIFPDCFISGQGLTPFKKTSEYVISAMMLGAIATLFSRRASFDPSTLRWIVAALVLCVAAEQSFTAYQDVYGVANMIGHVTTFASFYCLYRAIVVTGLMRPYDVLFRDLSRSERALDEERRLLESRVRERTADLAAANESLRTEVLHRRRAEEETRQLNAELEERVRKRTAQLEAANTELEAFLYSVSHDLRGPLRAIDGFSRVLLEHHAGALDAEGRRYLNVVRESTVRMDRLITELLSFSRLGRQEMLATRIDMRCLVSEVWAEIQQQSVGRKIEFTVGALPEAHGDRALLWHVLANLLSNAVKFSGTRELARIEVGGETRDGQNVYFVKDNGVGFDMKFAHKAFGVFQRLHRADEFEGTGVGLAVVQRIVERHGGRVWAEAEVNKGATFFFTLPVESGKEDKPR